MTSSDAAIQDLNDWFFANVEADPEQPGRLLSDWYSVAHDIALFLGDVMIERHSNLHWEFFTWGKTNVAFQRHVITGFSTEDPKFHTNINIHRMVATYAHQIVESRGSIPSYETVDVRGTAGRRRCSCRPAPRPGDRDGRVLALAPDGGSAGLMAQPALPVMRSRHWSINSSRTTMSSSSRRSPW